MTSFKAIRRNKGLLLTALLYDKIALNPTQNIIVLLWNILTVIQGKKYFNVILGPD